VFRALVFIVIWVIILVWNVDQEHKCVIHGKSWLGELLIYQVSPGFNSHTECNPTASVIYWSQFLATDPEVRVRFPALPDFLRSSGSGTGSTQPCEYN
jgi:hypothetical protein